MILSYFIVIMIMIAKSCYLYPFHYSHRRGPGPSTALLDVRGHFTTSILTNIPAAAAAAALAAASAVFHLPVVLAVAVGVVAAAVLVFVLLVIALYRAAAGGLSPVGPDSPRPPP